MSRYSTTTKIIGLQVAHQETDGDLHGALATAHKQHTNAIQSQPNAYTVVTENGKRVMWLVYHGKQHWGKYAMLKANRLDNGND